MILDVMLGLTNPQRDLLLMLGFFAVGLGIMIYVFIHRDGPFDAFDKSQPKWKQSKAFGCLRIIIYIIIILASLLGIMAWWFETRGSTIGK